MARLTLLLPPAARFAGLVLPPALAKALACADRVLAEGGEPALLARHFDLRPRGIIEMLDLLRPIYEKTAAYGHFGREEPEFTWEKTDKIALLRDAAGLK